MKLWKRLACAVALMLCTVLCAVGISAASVTASGTCYNLWWTLYNDGELVISGTGEMWDRPWSSYKSSIQTVTIGNSVTSIYGYAFRDCTNLTSVTIPDSVTSIGNSAFYNCDSLTGVTIPDSVTSIGNSAFYNCDSLTGVTIPDSVTSIGNSAFSNCDSLTEIKVSEENPNYSSDEHGVLFDKSKSNLMLYPKGNPREKYIIPDSVTSIGDSAFYNCDSLTSVTIPDSVTSIGEYAFSNCDSLTSVTIPDSVTSIVWYAFSSCTGLTSVTIPDSVTSIREYAFYNCDSLTSVTIPNSVTSLDSYSFEACTGLTSVTIPDSVTSIGNGVFRDCTALTSVTIPDSVTSIGLYAFYSCDSLTEIKVDEDNLNYSSDEYGVLFDKSKSNLIQYPEGNTRGEYAIPDSVTTIGNYAFHSCKSLTSVTIPEGVTAIGGWVFYSCAGMTDVTIPDSVTSIGNSAFYNCDSLTGVTIPDSVTSIGDKAFTYSDNLTSVTILSRDVKFGSSVFNYTPSNFTLYGYAGSTTETYANANGHKFVALDEAPETDAPETDVPETDAPETDAPETDAPETDAPETDAPETDVPETDAPETDAPETDAPETATFTLSSANARPGETVEITLSLENSNLINSVALYDLTYDTERLTFAGFADYETLEEKCAFGESFDDAQGIITFALTEDEALSGFLCTLLFEVKEDAAEGDAEISMTSLVKMDYTEIPSEVTAGRITVKHQLIGDINNDDVVDIRDARALFKYSMLPEFYPVDYPFSMDFNGDGYLDINDARLLFRYSMLPDIYPLA